MSQSQLFQELQERSQEVRRYCLFLKAVETDFIKLRFVNYPLHKIKNFDPELEKMLKATVFLLLYNLVESTMRGIIEYIYDTLRNHNVSFDDLNQNFQNHIINISGKTSLKNKEWERGIATDIIIFAAEQEGSFAGNLDAKKIKEILTDYGIQLSSKTRRTNSGRDLEVIKASRKDLAHGHRSFSETSRDYTSDDLLKMQKQVIFYLKEVLQDVKNYVNEQKYLKPR
ncbi:MAG: MAE_28990/MAE_18760 family HEPN-like nuclease [Microcystaceae cyanobacterium]